MNNGASSRQVQAADLSRSVALNQQRRASVYQIADPRTQNNKFLALAETAGAEPIVASDPHLTDMHPWRGIPILPPAAFLVGIR